MGNKKSRWSRYQRVYKGGEKNAQTYVWLSKRFNFNMLFFSENSKKRKAM
jgi:hypothetical protein